MTTEPRTGLSLDSDLAFFRRLRLRRAARLIEQRILLRGRRLDPSRRVPSAFRQSAPRGGDGRLRISISSEARLLNILRGVVRSRAQAAGFTSGDEDCLAMAIDEAAANVIRHTYASRPDGRLTLEIQTFPDRIEFVLEDLGPKVRPETIRPRSLEDVRPGGLGTFFIRCFMDRTSYDGDCVEGNRLRLVKYLPQRESDESPGQKRG